MILLTAKIYILEFSDVLYKIILVGYVFDQKTSSFIQCPLMV